MLKLPYLPPLGTPLYWRDEQSGVIAQAMMKFIRREPLSDEELKLARDYLAYAVKAPCWRFPLARSEEVYQMITRLEKASSADELMRATQAFLEFEIDLL